MIHPLLPSQIAAQTGKFNPKAPSRSGFPTVDAAGAPIYKVRQMAAGHTAAAVLYKNGIPTASKEI
jgi:hypothetical protein